MHKILRIFAIQISVKIIPKNGKNQKTMLKKPILQKSDLLIISLKNNQTILKCTDVIHFKSLKKRVYYFEGDIIFSEDSLNNMKFQIQKSIKYAKNRN